MIKSILVPTDFSKNANNAVDYAIELGKREETKIILLHAYYIETISPEVPLQFIDEQLNSVEQASKEKLSELCVKINKQVKVKCEIINKEGLAADLILEMSEKRKPDFIIMGTSGESGIVDKLLGNVAAMVIEKSILPVIAVPEKTKFAGINHITFATDYDSSDVKALKKLVDIAALFNAKITLLHAADNEFTDESEEEYMAKYRCKIRDKISYDKIEYKIVYGTNLVEVLEEYIIHESPDLFAMLTHFRSLYEKLFGKSYTQKIAYKSKVPVMAFHYNPELANFI